MSAAILVGVGLFVTAVAGTLIANARRPSAERVEVPPSTAGADYRIKEVHLREEAKRGTRWQLDAEQAEVYEQAGRTMMRKVRIVIEDPTRMVTVRSDEGEIAQATRDVVLRGNVVLVSSDGLRLETAQLHWNAKEERAWTDAPVTLYRGTVVVKGQGLDARIAEEMTAVKGRIRATFGAPPGASPAAEPSAGAARAPGGPSPVTRGGHR